MTACPHTSLLRRALPLAACCLSLVRPAGAIPPMTPREQYEVLIARGELDRGREEFRKELARLQEELQRAGSEPGIAELGRRATLLNDTALTLQSWADGEAEALHAKKGEPARALRVLEDEFLPSAVRVRDTRGAYLEEARRLEGQLDPSERQSSAWAFDAVRWSEEDQARLPLSLARLAKIAGSRADVDRVFAAFGGRVGTFRSAADYVAAPEDYDRTLRPGTAARVPRVPLALEAPGLTADEEGTIRALLTRYYAAVARRDLRAVRACFASTSPQLPDIKRGLRGRKVVSVGEIDRLTLERRPDGSVLTVVEDIPVTMRVEGREVARTGSQRFVLVRERDEWKIREVAR